MCTEKDKYPQLIQWAIAIIRFVVTVFVWHIILKCNSLRRVCPLNSQFISVSLSVSLSLFTIYPFYYRAKSLSEEQWEWRKKLDQWGNSQTFRLQPIYLNIIILIILSKWKLNIYATYKIHVQMAKMTITTSLLSIHLYPCHWKRCYFHLHFTCSKWTREWN